MVGYFQFLKTQDPDHLDFFINGDSLFIKELLNQSLDVTETINLSTNIFFLHSLRTLKIHIFPKTKCSMC